MTRLQQALLQAQLDLQQQGLRWALIGGLAVSIRSEPRTTQDIDVAIAISSDAEAEEVVAASEMLEILPEVAAPVATTAHLLALKTLAGRAKDIMDFANLAQHATERDLLEARQALELIASRGYHRDKDLQTEFSQLLERAPGEI